MIVQFPWPSPVLSPNKRPHWATKADAFKAAKTLAFYATKESKHPVALRFKLVFCPPNNRRRDADNLIASCKAYLDGMALAWGVDDSLFRWSFDFGPVIPGGRVIVEAWDAA